MARRLGKQLPEDSSTATQRVKTVEELALEQAVPKQRAFDTEPGAAFVAGVAEVPLSMEHRLRNIEATEAAKTALLVRGGGAYDGYGEANNGGGTKRSQFPIKFGRVSEKEASVIVEVQAKKAAARARALERKQQKQREFKGW